MKVKEAKEKITNLRKLYNNALKIQDYCLKQDSAPFITELETATGIDTTLRTFASRVAACIDEECKRINNLIDNTDVKIN